MLPSQTSGIKDPNLVEVITKRKAKENEKYIVFALFGFLSLYPLFIGFSEAVIFEEMFPNMRYTFFVTVPSYVCVIPVLILTKLLANVSVHTQMYVGIFSLGAGLAGVAITPFVLERNEFGKLIVPKTKS